MTTYVSPISENAFLLVQRFVKPDDRVLITGASGWFGRTSTLIFHKLGIPTYLTGSHSRTIEYLGHAFEIQKWNLREIERFQPTIVIDCAYLTREFAESVSLEEYVGINRELLNRMIEISKWPSVRKMISFSSGAAHPYFINAVTTGIDEDPYGFLKHEAEQRLTSEIDPGNCKISIPRVWSVSGALVTKIQGFAFSDLIFQARSGKIVISSNREVFRRYCAIEEVIAIAMADSLDSNPIFDTGGESIEIRDLAKRVCSIIDPKATITQINPLNNERNNYQSSNSDWVTRCSELDFEPITIDEQISIVSSWM
jgi:nucleoside-diphosphate-sugar epimerase